MYENNNRLLVDEAIAFEPIKNTFRLGWEFVKLNQQFTITAMIIFILLNLLVTIQVVSFIFMVLSAVFVILIQIYVGKTFYYSTNIESYVAQIEDSTIDNLVRKDISTAFGSYLGWFLLTLLFTTLLVSLSRVMGITPHMYMVGYDSINLFVVLVLPLLFISYIQPLVQANIILSNGFKEGFKAVFTLFSINLWRSSFQLSYFKYIVSFWLTIIIFLFLFSFFIGMLGTIGLLIMGNILIFILVYIFMITMAISSMMAKRLVEH